MNIYKITWLKPNSASQLWQLSSDRDVKAMLTLAYQLGLEAVTVYFWNKQLQAFTILPIHPSWFKCPQPDLP